MDPIVVVGGGIVGTSIAYHLRRSDRPVVLLERGMLGSGTTAKSAAMFTYHGEEPSELDIYLRQRSWDFYQRRIDAGELTFENIGTLELATCEERLEHVQTMRDHLADLGVEASVLAPEEVPGESLRVDGVLGALYLPQDGVLDPGEIVQLFVKRSRDAGVDIETDVAVTDVLVSDGAVVGVETDVGEIRTDTVINGTGPWAHELNALAGVSAPLRHTLGPIVVLNSPVEVSLPLTFFEEGVYFREEGNSQLFAGSHARGYEDAAVLDPSHAHGIDESMYLDISDVAAEYLSGGASLELANEWVGLRTITPDGLPLLGETNVDGFYLATGMGGYGVTLAPVVGEILSGALLGERTDDLLDRLSPRRFEAANEKRSSV